MDTSIESQILFLFYMFTSGCIIAFIYDLIRVSRIIIRTNDFFVCLEDILFVILSGIIIFIAAFEKNSGKIQLYGLVSALLGIILYALIIGNKFLRFLVFVIKIITKVIVFIFKIIFFPLKIVIKIFRKPCLVIIWRVKSAGSILKIHKNRLKSRLKATKISIFKK